MWYISWWLLPVIASLVWLAMLIAMIGHWGATGRPHYLSENTGQDIPFLSDIGAFSMKPVFIACSWVMLVLFTFTFMADRWLRHKGRLARNVTAWEKLLAVLATIFEVIGAAGIGFLTIFDTYHHHNAHSVLLIVFIAGYLISAVFVCCEYIILSYQYRGMGIFRMSFALKFFFIVVEFALAVAFGTMSARDEHHDATAICEWIVAFIFPFYVFSFAFDLYPGVDTAHHTPQGERAQMYQRRKGSDPAADPEATGLTTSDENFERNGFYRDDHLDPLSYRGQMFGR